MTELLVPERVAHPFWDGRKLLTVLQTKHSRVRDWTAPSTVAHRLARCGLVQRRRVRRPTTHPGAIPAVADAPNVLRTADFKGQFRTGDHANCYLLTVADFASRFLLTCHGLRSTTCELAKPSFERTFRSLEETDDGLWAIYFQTVLLATLDERDHIIQI